MRSGAQGAFKQAEMRPWRKPVEAQTLTLPFPPGVNHLFFNIPSQRGGRAITDVYKKWRFEAGLELMRQRSGCVFGKVDVTLTFEEPRHARRIDLDGLAKAVLDLAVEHGVIEGDDRRYVRKITLEWGAVVGCHVAIVKAAV